MIIEVSSVSQTKTSTKKNPAMLLMLVIGAFLFVAALSFCSLTQSSSPQRALLEVPASTQGETGLKSDERNLAYANYGNEENYEDAYGNPYGYDSPYGNNNADPYANDNGVGSSNVKTSLKRNNHHHSKKKNQKVNNGAVINPASTPSTATGTTNNVASTSSTTTVSPSTATTPATGSTNTRASTNTVSTSTQPATVSNTNTGSTNTNAATPASTGSTSTTTATTAITGTTNPNILTYSSNEVCSNGNTAYLSGLTADQKAVILATHNTYRSLVALGNAAGQPGATNMLEMVWDDDLAAKAQSWADACTFDHDSDSDRSTTKFSNVGQNIDLQMYSNKKKQIDFTTFVKDWFDEVKLFSGAAPTDSYQDISGTGHYTQLVWAKSYAVGCGFKVYQDSGMYSYQLTCNYGPAGNWIGEKIYTQGTFNAANCKNGASSTYQGLCNH